MKRNKWSKVFMLTACAAMVFFAVSGATAAKKEISMTSYGVGSQAYIFSAGIG